MAWNWILNINIYTLSNINQNEFWVTQLIFWLGSVLWNHVRNYIIKSEHKWLEERISDAVHFAIFELGNMRTILKNLQSKGIFWIGVLMYTNFDWLILHFLCSRCGMIFIVSTILAYEFLQRRAHHTSCNNHAHEYFF